MKISSLISAALTTLIILLSQNALAEDSVIYGSQLMTEQERIEHRNRMRNAESQEERDRIRAEHHKRMQERAQQQGLKLPDEPPMRGKGMQGKGYGSGMNRGMGQRMDQGRGNR